MPGRCFRGPMWGIYSAVCWRSAGSLAGRRCLDLVLANPHLGSEAWERRLRQALDPGDRRPRPQKPSPLAEEAPDDGAVFHYCTVSFRNAPVHMPT